MSVHQPLDVLKDRIAVVAGLTQPRIGVGAQQHRIWTIDADEPQLSKRLRDRIRIGANVGRKRASPDCWFPRECRRCRRRHSLRRSRGLRQRPKAVRHLSRAANPNRWRHASTSSICWRLSSKGTRSSTSALTSRCRARIPSSGAATLRKWPVPMAGVATPLGPCTSTTRLPAR